MNKHKYVRLMESGFEKAEIAVAIQNISDSIQKMAEDLSKIKIESISALNERIKAEFGIEKAKEFNDTITQSIDEVLSVVMKTKDGIDTEKLKITGDVEETSDLETDLGGETDIEKDISAEDDVDLDTELPSEDEGGAGELMSGTEAGRELKTL